MEKNRNSNLKPITVLLCLCVLLVHATLFGQQKLQFGMSAALDFTMLSSNGPVHPRPGGAIHAVSSLTLLEKLSLQASLGYAIRPYHVQEDGLILESDIDPLQGVVSSSSLIYKGTYHEFQLPLLLKLHLQSTRRGPYIGAGPMVGVAFGHSGKGELHLGNGTNVPLADLSYRTEPKIALQACLGHRMPLTAVHDLSLELYGNVYSGMFFLVPARTYTAGIRAGLWL